MSSLSGYIAGALGLTMLQVAVTNAKNTSAVITVPASLLTRWINPYTPLIPDLRTVSAANGAAPTTAPPPAK